MPFMYKKQSFNLSILPLNKFFFFVIFFCISGFTQAQDTYLKLMDASPAPKVLQVNDWVYEPRIRSVQFYARNGRNILPDKNDPPIVQLNAQSTQQLMLEFDELGDEADYYEAKVFHCNHDWTISNELAINYLEDYNEFNLNDFELAANTRVNYSHFIFEVPHVKISGNYLLKIYREGDEDDLVITRRFVVYQQQTAVGLKQVRILGGGDYLKRQQIDFTVNYGGLKFARQSPQDEIKVVVRQNYRWDNAITDLKPRFVNQLRTTLQYDMTDLSNSFLGGNEFRHFDFGTFQRVGFNIDKVIRHDTINQVLPFVDKNRAFRTYDEQAIDMDGNYIVANREFPAETQADYSEVNFRLNTGNPLTQEVYVVGKFSDWQLKPENKMTYQAASGTYYATLILKQGAYDYMYAMPASEANVLEGNHFRTRNDYDIIVYFRPFGARGDRVIGYGRLESLR